MVVAILTNKKEGKNIKKFLQEVGACSSKYNYSILIFFPRAQGGVFPVLFASTRKKGLSPLFYGRVFFFTLLLALLLLILIPGFCKQKKKISLDCFRVLSLQLCNLSAQPWKGWDVGVRLQSFALSLRVWLVGITKQAKLCPVKTSPTTKSRP